MRLAGKDHRITDNYFSGTKDRAGSAVSLVVWFMDIRISTQVIDPEKNGLFKLTVSQRLLPWKKPRRPSKFQSPNEAVRDRKFSIYCQDC